MSRVSRAFAGVAVGVAVAAHGADPVTILPEITVEDRAVAVETWAAQPAPFDSGLFRLPSLNLQAQGAGQTDLRVRGSAFSSTGLSIAGLALRNPQTEHFHLELPLPSALLEAPVLLTGTDQLLDSTAHFAGSASADFTPVSDRRILQLGVGERNTASIGTFLETQFPGREDWGVSLFGFKENRGGADYSDNDVDRWQGGVRLQNAGPDHQIDVVAAHQERWFGARGFYGASPAGNSAENVEDTLLMATGRWNQQDGGTLRASASWRQFRDYYVWERDVPSWYENWHRSTVTALSLDGDKPLGDDVSLRWRTDWEQEKLASTSFGDFRRERAGLTLAPVWQVGDVELTAGVRTLAFTDDTPAYLGLASAAWQVNETNRLFLSFSQNTRRPSYTELYYNSVSSIGNPDLDRQDSEEVEAGWTGQLSNTVEASATVFCRRTHDTVDWVRPTAASVRWEATNLDAVETAGFELSTRYQPAPNWVADLAYTYLNKDHDTDFYSSRYVLDYARHQVSLALRWSPVPSLQLYMVQTLSRYRQNEFRTTDRDAVQGRIGLGYTPSGIESLLLSLDVQNMWDEQFEIYPGQLASRRQVMATATLAF